MKRTRNRMRTSDAASKSNLNNLDVDQLEPEEMPTVADHTTDPTGDMRRDPTHGGNSWQDPSPTRLGNSWRTLAARGNFTRTLAHLANTLFTHGDPYRALNESDPDDPCTYGNFTGNLIPLMATLGNLTRRLIMAFQGPTEAAQDLPHSKDNLPYLPEGNFTEVTSGITKEITANSQDPDQTSRRSRPSLRRFTKSHREDTKENYHLPHFHHPLSMSSRYHIHHKIPPHHFTIISPHHYLPSLPPSFITLSQNQSATHLPYSPSCHYFTISLPLYHPHLFQRLVHHSTPLTSLISPHHH